MNTLIIKCKEAVSDPSNLSKMENFIGIEFIRGAADGGSTKGYHQLIGDAGLMESMALFNKMQTISAKDGKVVKQINNVNWFQNLDGTEQTLMGEDGEDILVQFPEMYAILGGSDPVYERWIFSDKPFYYGEDEAELIESFALCPDNEVIYEGVARCIYGCSAGSMGTTKATNISDGSFASGAGYPSVWLSRYAYENYAVLKNTNSGTNFPCCNENAIDWRVIQGMLYVECRTKNINSVLGHGVSANIFPTEANWGTVTGIRTQLSDGTYKYLSFETQVRTGATSSSSIWNILNGEYTLLKVMEAQTAVSNGATLESVSNVDVDLFGKNDGVMTGIYTKTFTFKANVGFTSTEIQEYTFECVVKVPIWRGICNLWGNIYETLSGIDIIRYWADDEKTSQVNELYVAKTIADIESNNNVGENLTDKSGYTFTATYEYLGDLGSKVSTWCTDSWYTNGKNCIIGYKSNDATSTPNINNYESAYTFLVDSQSDDEFVTGEFQCNAPRFGGVALSTRAVLRYARAFRPASYASPHFGSRFRMKIG